MNIKSTVLFVIGAVWAVVANVTFTYGAKSSDHELWGWTIFSSLVSLGNFIQSGFAMLSSKTPLDNK